MNKSLLKTISFLVGGLSVIVGGLIYVLITDVYLLNTSTWLFLAIFASLGSGIGFILADNIKKKLFWRYFVKGLCLVLSVCFIVVIFRYSMQFDANSKYYNEAVITLVRQTKRFKIAKIVSIANGTAITALVFGFLATIVQSINIVFDIVFKEED